MNEIAELLKLRVVASFLGEKSQYNWWQSDFFSATAPSFLNPVFPRTRFLAQAEGSSAAARNLHDERIGVGRVFHLFRLPEDFEQSFHQRLQEASAESELSELLSSQEAALNYLETTYGDSKSDDVGPVLVGNINEIASDEVVGSIAQAYLAGFRKGTPVFPYLKDEK
ncbi:MAG: BrxE family protein [Planctomycetota bacterium]